MSFFSVCLFVSIIPIVVHAAFDKWGTHFKQHIDSSTFRESLKLSSNEMIDFNLKHSLLIMKAIHEKKHTVMATDSNHGTAGWDLSDYYDVASRSYYDTLTTFDLFSGIFYYSLDSTLHTTAVRGLTADHILHCPSEASPVASVGDVFIASENGRNIRSLHSHVKEYFASDKKILKSKGFIFIRRVVSIETLNDLSSPCSKYITEDLHPIEIFDKVKIESLLDHPFTTYTTLDPSFDARKNRAKDTQRKTNTFREGNYTQPTPPVKSCTDPLFQNHDDRYQWEGHGNGSWYDYYYKWTHPIMCAQIEADLPGSFNFNYDYITGKATNNIPLVDGITCSNCYAFFGAGLLFIFEYSSQYGLLVEAKVSAGTGLNLNIDVDAIDLMVSGSTTFTVNFDSKPSVIPLFAGFDLSSSMRSMKLTLSGSGVASGKLNFGGGASAFASLAMMYTYNYTSSQSSIQFPCSFPTNYNPPHLDVDSLSVKSLSLGVSLAATMGYELNYWGGFLYADSSITLLGYTEMAYGAVAASSFEVSVNPLTSRRKLQSSTTDSIVLLPGDVLPITILYQGFEPNEALDIFYSVSSVGGDAGDDYPILQAKTNVSSTGDGSHSIEWVVPWDEKYKGNLTWVVKVHASNLMSKTVSSEFSFIIEEFTETDTIFYPSKGIDDIVSIDKSYNLTWNATLLQYFEEDIGTGGHGTLRICPEVSLYLVAERSSILVVNNTGPSMTSSTRAILEHSIPNSGSSTVSFPVNETFTSFGSRYYIQIVCNTKTTVSAWSGGYFDFASSPSSALSSLPSLSSLSSLPSLPSLSSSRITKGVRPAVLSSTGLSASFKEAFGSQLASFRTKYGSDRHLPNTAVHQPHLTDALATCGSRQIRLTLGVQSKAVMEKVGVRFLGYDLWSYAVSLSSNTYDLYGPHIICLDLLTDAPTPEPTTAPTIPNLVVITTPTIANNELFPNPTQPTPSPNIPNNEALTSSSSQTQSSSAWAIVGGLIGGIFVCVIFVLSLWYYYCYYMNSKSLLPEVKTKPESGHVSSVDTKPQSGEVFVVDTKDTPRASEFGVLHDYCGNDEFTANPLKPASKNSNSPNPLHSNDKQV